MKIAVCISGLPRNYDKGFKELKKWFLNKYDCDVYIHTWYDTTSIFETGHDYLEKKWKKNKWTPDAKGYDKKGHVYFEKEYNPKNWNPATGFETIPAHEFGHLVDDGGSRIPQSTKEKIYKYTQGGDKKYPNYKIGDKVFDYESTPSEFINRIQPIRYLLNQQGIYDARKKQFTKDDYNKMIKNPTILKNVHYQDIFKSLKGTDQEKMNNFIDLMNTVAMNKNNDSSSLNNFT